MPGGTFSALRVVGRTPRAERYGFQWHETHWNAHEPRYSVRTSSDKVIPKDAAILRMVLKRGSSDPRSIF